MDNVSALYRMGTIRCLLPSAIEETPTKFKEWLLTLDPLNGFGVRHMRKSWSCQCPLSLYIMSKQKAAGVREACYVARNYHYPNALPADLVDGTATSDQTAENPGWASRFVGQYDAIVDTIPFPFLFPGT